VVRPLTNSCPYTACNFLKVKAHDFLSKENDLPSILSTIIAGPDILPHRMHCMDTALLISCKASNASILYGILDYVIEKEYTPSFSI
jgi:hypothetical protein